MRLRQNATQIMFGIESGYSKIISLVKKMNVLELCGIYCGISYVVIKNGDRYNDTLVNIK